VYRARLCAQGFTQVPGIDHKDNFSHVVTDITFRMVMVLAFIFVWIAISLICEVTSVTYTLHGHHKRSYQVLQCP